jgi:MbtH protein
MTEDDTSSEIYQVVRNHEEQYSIWPAARDLPEGWTAAGPAAPKQDCLDYIAEVWTDMRPLSLRRQLAAASGQGE